MSFSVALQLNFRRFTSFYDVFMPFYATFGDNFGTNLWKRFQNRKFDWQNGVSLL